MEYTFYEQSTAFLYSILLGVALALVYEPLKIMRISIFKKKFATVVIDILFMLLVTVATFLFALAFLNGSVRFYMILGEIVGFSLFYFTFGKLLEKILLPTISFVKGIIAKIINVLKKIIKNLLKILYKVLYNVGEKIYKFVSFFKNHFKSRNRSKKKGKGQWKKQRKRARREKNLPKTT